MLKNVSDISEPIVVDVNDPKGRALLKAILDSAESIRAQDVGTAHGPPSLTQNTDA